MERESYRWLAHITLEAGETFSLPQHIEQLVGLVYFRLGSGILLEKDSGSIMLEGKSAALYPGWEPRRLTVCEKSVLLIGAFRCDRPDEVLAGWMEKSGPVQDCRGLPDAQRLLPQLDALSPGLEQSAQLATQLLLTMLGRAGGEDVPAYLQVMSRIIETRYAEDITLDLLSAQVGKSKFHLSRAFREHYQMSPGAYLTSVRLTRAAELLTGTDLPVREIGQQVGFANNAYFTARFKEKYGHPPREYRFMNRTTEVK